MNYLHRDKRRSSSKFAFKVIALVIVLIGVSFFFKSFLQNTLFNLQKGVGYAFGYYAEPVRPISENSLLAELRSENDNLKNLLGRRPETDDRVFSVVLSRPPRTPYDSLIVDVGENQGLMPGDMVYGEMEYLIGRVESVKPTTSVVKLFSTPDERIDVLLGRGSTTAPVVAEGRGGGNFYIKVPRNIIVEEGDPIVVPGFNSYILGTAEKVDAGEGEAYAQVYFKLPVNLNSLRYVQIKKAVR